MGPESDSSPVVAYINGQPVEIGHPLPEITLANSAEEASAAMAAASSAWANLSMAIEVVAEGIREFFNATELAMAVRPARIFEPAMAHRYLHTKKKRTRKKYEKRIRAWFREVFR